MTDEAFIIELYHSVKNRWNLRRCSGEAPEEELIFLVRLLNRFEAHFDEQEGEQNDG